MSVAQYLKAAAVIGLTIEQVAKLAALAPVSTGGAASTGFVMPGIEVKDTLAALPTITNGFQLVNYV